MSKFALVTDEEEPRDLGDLARSIQWAELIVNAALPEDSANRSRAMFRNVAFSCVLRATIEHRYTARPSVLEALMDGHMPPVEDAS